MNILPIISVKSIINYNLFLNLLEFGIQNIIVSSSDKNIFNNNAFINNLFITEENDKNKLFLLAKERDKDKHILFLNSDWNISTYSLYEFFSIDFEENYYNFPVFYNNKKQYVTMLINKKIEQVNFKHLTFEYLQDSVKITKTDDYIFFTCPNNLEEKSIVDLNTLKHKDFFYIGHFFYMKKEYKIASDYFARYIKSHNELSSNDELYYSYYYLGCIFNKIEYLKKSQEINIHGIESLLKLLETYPEDTYYIKCLEDSYKTNSMLQEWDEFKKHKFLTIYYFDKDLYKTIENVLICLKIKGDEEIENIWKICNDKLQINDIKQNNSDIITVAIIAKDAEIYLDLYLKCITLQSWPKYKTNIYIRSNNNKDNTVSILTNWIEKYRNEYNDVFVDFSNIEEKVEEYGRHEWNSVRFSVLSKIREDSVKWAGNTHYFTCDCDNFIDSDTIEKMFMSEKDVISPLLISTPHTNEPFTNFHTVISEDGNCVKDEKYIKIVNCEDTGFFEVPIVHCCYFLRNNVLKHAKYSGDSFEYLVFSKNLRDNNIKQYVDNTKCYGYITFAENREELDKEIWLKFL